MATISVTDGEFDSKVLESGIPVLVDFWAPTCGPCVAIAPVLEKIASEYQGDITVAKVNIAENPNLAADYGIRSIPFLAMFKGGQITDTITGAPPPQKLIEIMENALKES